MGAGSTLHGVPGLDAGGMFFFSLRFRDPVCGNETRRDSGWQPHRQLDMQQLCIASGMSLHCMPTRARPTKSLAEKRGGWWDRRARPQQFIWRDVQEPISRKAGEHKGQSLRPAEIVEREGKAQRLVRIDSRSHPFWEPWNR
jgi:hypothetical protein